MVLKIGSRGDAVKRVQQALKDEGFDIVADGDFGAKTQKAVKEFQQRKGLTADGIVGSMTLAALGVNLDGPDAAPVFTHRVRLHFRSLSLTDTAFDTLLSSTCTFPMNLMSDHQFEQTAAEDP